jgi:hypothetical protein
LTSAPGANTLPASGSWPLSRYLGRGTPIDRGRASEWSGGKPEGGANGEDVAEDGVLFSTVRSTSIDSTPQPSQRSISPLAEWNYISPPPLVYTPYSARRRSTVSLGVEPLPESVKIQLKGIDPNSSAEWASSTQQVLASPISAASTSTSTPELSSETETQFESAMQSAEELQLRTPDADEHERGGEAAIERDMERERVRAREMDLGLETLHAAVDQGLGLIPGGMTWFDVGILPGSGRASPSVYSCDQPSTPRISRPQSVDPSETRTEARFALRERLETHLWWRRFLSRLRRLREILRRHRNEG